MLINVGNIPVRFEWFTDATEKEAANYVKYVKERVEGNIKSITVMPNDDDTINLYYEVVTTPFERIRRMNNGLFNRIIGFLE